MDMDTFVKERFVKNTMVWLRVFCPRYVMAFLVFCSSIVVTCGMYIQ